MSVREAVHTVLAEAKTPLTVEEIYKQIETRKLFTFNTPEPKTIVRQALRRHCVGLAFPSARPVKYFRLVGTNRYELAPAGDTSSQVPCLDSAVADRLPDELIAEAHRKHLRNLSQELKEKLLANRPVYFERLVLQLIEKMGYGSGLHTGKSGDGGIDGIVKEDRLGLDKIYLQAKRYNPENKVGRPEVQQFAGAMGHVRKGVLLTTSSFTADALSFLATADKTISLIDGDELCRLMIEHGVGVTEVASYKVYRLDTDFFTDDE